MFPFAEKAADQAHGFINAKNADPRENGLDAATPVGRIGRNMTDAEKLRTMLANERTMLAYIRTALSAWIFSLAVIKLFAENFLIVCFGWIIAISGIIILLWGIFESRRRHRYIHT